MITTRGILLDIPRLRGTEHITLDAPVRGWELEAAAEKEGIEVRTGDAVLVYSGREKFYANSPDAAPEAPPTPGLHADTAPVLKKWDAGILGWDCLDAGPSEYEMFQRSAGGPVHVLTIVFMRLPLLDNALLEPLAEVCVDKGVGSSCSR